jgi:hypothetical protein
VSFSSMELSRKHAGRAVCFVWLFVSVYRLCVKISDLFSLLCLLAPCGAGNGCVFVNMKERSPSVSRQRQETRLFIPAGGSGLVTKAV